MNNHDEKDNSNPQRPSDLISNGKPSIGGVKTSDLNDVNINMDNNNIGNIGGGEINLEEEDNGKNIYPPNNDNNFNEHSNDIPSNDINLETQPKLDCEPHVENDSTKQSENENKSIEKDTLDETVGDTLKRDCFRIYNKLKHVIIPRLYAKKYEELQNWDLWGPLIFCFLLGISLSTAKDKSKDEESSVFILVFVIFWIGGAVISLNASFLGGKIGICQMICLLGYCMFPITVSSIIIAFCGVEKTGIKLLLSLISFLWSCLASVGFVSGLVSLEKRAVAVYPIFLFYLALSLFVLNY